MTKKTNQNKDLTWDEFIEGREKIIENIAKLMEKNNILHKDFNIACLMIVRSLLDNVIASPNMQIQLDTLKEIYHNFVLQALYAEHEVMKKGKINLSKNLKEVIKNDLNTNKNITAKEKDHIRKITGIE